MEYSLEEISAIESALGAPRSVQYECAHVYPISVPNFHKSDIARPSFTGPYPFKLYLHIPFCNYACTFCFYYKTIGANDQLKEKYVDALIQELDEVPAGLQVSQVYIGGGTPTTLQPKLLSRLMKAVFERNPILSGASFVVETSPESLSADHCSVFSEYGVNRISMGVDSLNPHILDLINRKHTSTQALDACRLLLCTDKQINIDLIYGFPEQTEDDFKTDFNTFADLNVHSFTLYNLRLNELTPLRKKINKDKHFDLEGLVRWREFVAKTALNRGYIQTRGHTFVRREMIEQSYDRAPCIDGYLEGRQIGLGASSISHIGNVAYRNVEDIKGYLNRISGGLSPVSGIQNLLEEDSKALFFARTVGEVKKIDKTVYEHTFKMNLKDEYGDLLEEYIKAGIMIEDETGFELTDLGRYVYDIVLTKFYPESKKSWLNTQQEKWT